MSSSLHWRAAPPPPEPMGSAGPPLKRIIIDHYWNGDPGAGFTEPVIVEITDQIVLYLRGHASARYDEEIEQFLRDLAEHKRLEVWIND